MSHGSRNMKLLMCTVYHSYNANRIRYEARAATDFENFWQETLEWLGRPGISVAKQCLEDGRPLDQLEAPGGVRNYKYTCIYRKGHLHLRVVVVVAGRSNVAY